MAESGGETCDLGTRRDLELLSYELLIKARVFHRADTVSGGRESEHELFCHTRGERIRASKTAPPRHALPVVACLRRMFGKELNRVFILSSQSRPVGVYPRLELPAFGKMNSVEQGTLVEADRDGPLTGANRFLELPYV